MKKISCVENSLFKFDGWDGDQECEFYYGVTLTRDVGELKRGMKFDHAYINFDDGLLSFYNDKDKKTEYLFNICLEIKIM